MNIPLSIFLNRRILAKSKFSINRSRTSLKQTPFDSKYHTPATELRIYDAGAFRNLPRQVTTSQWKLL